MKWLCCALEAKEKAAIILWAVSCDNFKKNSVV